MKAFQIAGGFGLENLKLVDLPEPKPGPGQVLVRLRAASLNYRDLLTVKGQYNPKLPLPKIPLSDGAGEVDERRSAGLEGAAGMRGLGVPTDSRKMACGSATPAQRKVSICYCSLGQ